MSDTERMKEGPAFWRIYMQWNIQVKSPLFSTDADLERSFPKSPETNTEEEHAVNK